MLDTLDNTEIKYLTDFRRHLHKNPELSNKEELTAKEIVKELRICNPSQLITKVGGHGILAIFTAKTVGETILFRAELDALPIHEENGFEHQSINPQISHKCGHDGHAAMLLGLARQIKSKPLLKGSVALLFQPAEETGEGAKAVLEDKKFKQLKPDFVFALHNVPSYKKGEIIVRSGAFTASVISLKISLKGKTSHAAEPEHGINPDLAVQELILAIKALGNNDIKSEEFSVITTVFITLGSKDYGISAGDAELHFTIRCWTSSQLKELKNKIGILVLNVSEKHQLKVALDWFSEFESNNNTVEAVHHIKKAATSNNYFILEKENPFKWGEDFGLFTQHFKGAMFALGAGINTPALHHPDYDFPDEIIPIGIQMFYK
jgi:amidohydrolase